jgi:hypothetical protein
MQHLLQIQNLLQRQHLLQRHHLVKKHLLLRATPGMKNQWSNTSLMLINLVLLPLVKVFLGVYTYM